MNKDFLSQLEKNFGKYDFSTIDVPLEKSYWKQLLYSNSLPKGKIIEISGEKSSGKSTLVLDLLSSIYNINALFVDAEYSFDYFYAEQKGINLNRTMILKNNKYKIIFDIIEQVLFQNILDIIIIDSFAAIDFKNYAELQKSFLKLVTLINKSNCTLVLTNQLRNKFNTRNKTSFGSKLMKFHLDIRLKVSNRADYKKDALELIVTSLKHNQPSIKVII